MTRGIQLGHIFKLGTTYSEALGAAFLGRKGRERPLFMGWQGIGIGRLIAAAIEQSHDEQRMIWLSGVAPYQIHLIVLRTNHRSWTQRNLSMKDCKQSGMKFSTMIEMRLPERNSTMLISRALHSD